ncbi:MAG: prephenate dehydrogenase/arogenate dehydrogenase family protein [archaeon]
MVFQDITSFKQNGNIGIVGGGGKMGGWALTLFNQLGYNNLFYNGRRRNREIENSTGVKFIESKKEIAEIADLLIISVPISKTLDIINEIGPFVDDNMIFSDFTSVKQKTCEAMGKYSKRVIGIHPMFKETVENLKNKNIALTPLDVKEQCDDINFLRTMFDESGAKVRIVSPEVHDKITSFNQAGVHLILMAYGNLLRTYCRKNNFRLADLESLNTPNSQLMNLLLGRFLAAGNYDVIWGIQNSSDESKKIRKIFLESAQAVVKNLDEDDSRQFEADILTISKKFKKVRMAIENEDSSKLVTSLGDFGLEKRFDDQKKIVASILKETDNILKIIENGKDIDGSVIRAIRSCAKMSKDFDYNNYKECIASAQKCKKILEKTVMKGKRRWQSPIRDDFETYEKLNKLISNFIEECKKLNELSNFVNQTSNIKSQ